MESIGQILKDARERRQISIANVAVATKMTSTYVKAIEADNFDVFVAPVYARGFIKLYAACVGLDPMPLLKQFGVASRAMPALALRPPPKAPSGKASAAFVEKLKPKPEQEKIGSQSKAVSPAALAIASPLRAGAHTLTSRLSSSCLACLRAGRLTALKRMFSARVQWPRFNLLRRMSPFLALPVIVWRRIFIVACVALLIIAAGLAWELSHRGLPSMTDACRWLAEPPAPYLDIEARPASPGR